MATSVRPAKPVPVMADQELFTTVRYWEGAVDVDGLRDEVSVEGRGYVELTGYPGRPDLRSIQGRVVHTRLAH